MEVILHECASENSRAQPRSAAVGSAAAIDPYRAISALACPARRRRSACSGSQFKRLEAEPTDYRLPVMSQDEMVEAGYVKMMVGAIPVAPETEKSAEEPAEESAEAVAVSAEAETTEPAESVEPVEPVVETAEATEEVAPAKVSDSAEKTE